MTMDSRNTTEVVVESEKPKAPSKKIYDSNGDEFTIPDFTIKQIRDAIPKHCYERSAVTSLAYVARDIACIATTFYLYYNYVTPEYISSPFVRGSLGFLYTFVQGLFGTGIWILGHECGHQAFSESRSLNDTVGWVLHSALLVPYFAWKISHGKHHKATGNIDRDVVFVPPTRDEYASRFGKLCHEISELTEDTPIRSAYSLVMQQLLGWQLYLFTNIAGNKSHNRQYEKQHASKTGLVWPWINHFTPAGPLFGPEDESQIYLSNLGLALVGSALYWVGSVHGWSNLFVWYFAPYFWVHHWLVAITFLHHTDPSLPHYTDDAWNFARGASATIDRNFWPIGPYFFHDIIETHVLHHLVSTIPFYHAEEATEAIKPIMGSHYREDTNKGIFGFFKSLWWVVRTCQWVEDNDGDDKGVLFYRNRNGLGEKPAVIKGR